LLRGQPDHQAALNLIGVLLVQLGRFEEAERFVGAAVRNKSATEVTFYNYGLILMQLGRSAEALTYFDLAVARNPAAPETWINRGAALNNLKRFDDALASFDKAIAFRPDSSEAYYNKGNSLRALGRFEEAVVSYDRVLALNPRHVQALHNRANALFRLKRFEDACLSFEHALVMQPNFPKAHLGRGETLMELGRLDEALAACDTALSLQADLADGWAGRGHALCLLRRLDDALSAYDRALALDSLMPAAWNGRGNVHAALKRFDQAAVDYDRALALDPNLAIVWEGRGNLLFETRQLDKAVGAYDRALAIEPGLASAWCNRGAALLEQNRLSEALSSLDHALAIKPHLAAAISLKVFALDFHPSADFDAQQQARHVWWQQVGAKLAPSSPPRFGNSLDPARRLVIGYVSNDFREHSAAYTFGPALLNHDKSQVEMVCYSCWPCEDEHTREFKRRAAKWRDTSQFSDDRLAEQVQADRIDILVDLSGHSGGNRLEVFARKPAPIQVTAWGHATGTGLATIDYLFSDPVALPPSARHGFAEKIYDLPCLITMTPPPYDLPPADPPVLSRQSVTFGVFNRVIKISEQAIAVWAQVLQRVSQSRLLIKGPGLQDALQNQIQGQFESLGIAADRLGFLPLTPRKEHLLAYDAVDICLDPFPQNGGISTWEALYRGVPVVAMLGNSIPNRLSGAILSSIGMGEWVGANVEEYLEIALKYAAVPEYLRQLRHELPGMIEKSASGNGVRYAQAVEAAYREMWVSYCGRTGG
jgi:predicted O-linked N-acetylglucosamine transferase (SPINDLY family)